MWRLPPPPEPQAQSGSPSEPQAQHDSGPQSFRLSLAAAPQRLRGSAGPERQHGPAPGVRGVLCEHGHPKPLGMIFWQFLCGTDRWGSDMWMDFDPEWSIDVERALHANAVLHGAADDTQTQACRSQTKGEEQGRRDQREDRHGWKAAKTGVCYKLCLDHTG